VTVADRRERVDAVLVADWVNDSDDRGVALGTPSVDDGRGDGVADSWRPSRRTTAAESHGTNQSDCPSNTPPKNAVPPMAGAAAAGHESYAVVLPLLLSMRNTTSAPLGTSHTERPSNKAPRKPPLMPLNTFSAFVLPERVSTTMTAVPAEGTIHIDVPSNVPPTT
jgi:hypothetical protein